MAIERVSHFDHPAWYTAASTLVGWGVIMFAVFLVLFVAPYLAVSLL